MSFQLCIPPQQISPSAAMRSPYLLGDIARPAEGLGDLFLIAVRIGRPIMYSGRPNRFGRRQTYKFQCHSAAAQCGRPFRPWRQICRALPPNPSRNHRQLAARRARPRSRPQARSRRSCPPNAGCRLCSNCSRNVRIGKKEVHAFEFAAVGPRGRRQLEHGVEVDRRLRIRPLANQTRPHRVVELRVVIPGHTVLPFVASGQSQRSGPTDFASQPCLPCFIILIWLVTKISKGRRVRPAMRPKAEVLWGQPSTSSPRTTSAPVCPADRAIKRVAAN